MAALARRPKRSWTGCAGAAPTSASWSTDQFAFGEDVPASYVEFVDEMLAATPFEVLAEFFPNFEARQVLGAATFERVPDHDHVRHQGRAHLDRAQPQDARIAGAAAGRVRRRGHMVILERAEQVNGASTCSTSRRRQGGVARVDRPRWTRSVPEAAEVSAVIHDGFGAREVLDPPSRPPTRRRRPWRRPHRHGGLLRPADIGPVGPCSSSRTATCSGSARLGAPGRAARGVARGPGRRRGTGRGSSGLRGCGSSPAPSCPDGAVLERSATPDRSGGPALTLG